MALSLLYSWLLAHLHGSTWLLACGSAGAPALEERPYSPLFRKAGIRDTRPLLIECNIGCDFAIGRRSPAPIGLACPPGSEPCCRVLRPAYAVARSRLSIPRLTDAQWQSLPIAWVGCCDGLLEQAATQQEDAVLVHKDPEFTPLSRISQEWIG